MDVIHGATLVHKHLNFYFYTISFSEKWPEIALRKRRIFPYKKKSNDTITIIIQISTSIYDFLRTQSFSDYINTTAI